MGGNAEFGDCILYRLQNAIEMVDDIVVPESDDAIAATMQINCTAFVIQTVGVLTSVDFDDEPQFVARKIREEGTDRRLSTKMMRLERLMAQMLPKLFLGLCHAPA